MILQFGILGFSEKAAILLRVAPGAAGEGCAHKLVSAADISKGLEEDEGRSTRHIPSGTQKSLYYINVEINFKNVLLFI